MESVICPECGCSYKHLANHWAQGSCNYPDLTDRQFEVATGLLMGDGWIDLEHKNVRLRSEMISKNYLEYVDDIFGVLGLGVSLKETASESAESARERGFSPGANSRDYSDLYKWSSRSHPAFSEFSRWYSSGEKIWPDDLKLTPTVLKHWYCGDGHWENCGNRNRIRISICNESDNTDKISKIFTNRSLPKPYYNFSERKEHTKCECIFTVDQSKELWEYMGEPLPDFKYKWPEKYR